jgi:hypothetical protein
MQKVWPLQKGGQSEKQRNVQRHKTHAPNPMSRHHRDGTICTLTQKKIETENALGAKGRLPSSGVHDREYLPADRPSTSSYSYSSGLWIGNAMHASIDDEVFD